MSAAKGTLLRQLKVCTNVFYWVPEMIWQTELDDEVIWSTECKGDVLLCKALRDLSCRKMWHQEGFSEGERSPSSHIPTGDDAEGFIQCCIEMPGNDVDFPNTCSNKSTFSAYESMIYKNGLCVRWKD